MGCEGAMDILSCFDGHKFPELSRVSADGYSSAVPFPHVVLDDFLPHDTALALAESFPDLKSTELDAWRFHDNQNTSRWFQEDSTKMPQPLREFSAACVSRAFLQFLATLTRIPELTADPYFIGGGAMVTANGGFLKIHADFNWHALLRSWRRVNALFYLTPDWQSDWGGDLELWSRDGSQRVVSVAPKFNRLVVFSTTSDSFHGQPTPLRTPPGVSRNIFSAFYYSSNRGAGTDLDPHFTKYSLERSPYGQAVMSDYLATPSERAQ